MGGYFTIYKNVISLFSHFPNFKERFQTFSCSILCSSSVYQVVVEEERPRRAQRTAEILRCYPIPIHFQNATLLSSPYYFSAEFPASSIKNSLAFTIGDNKTYEGYWNAPLLPHKSYSVYYQAVSTANGVSACCHDEHRLYE